MPRQLVSRKTFVDRSKAGTISPTGEDRVVVSRTPPTRSENWIRSEERPSSSVQRQTPSLPKTISPPIHWNTPDVDENNSRRGTANTWLQNQSSVSHPTANTPWALIIGIFAAAVVIILLVLALTPYKEVGTVESVKWSMTINLQEYVSRPREGWNLPGNATLIRSENRFHHNDQVVDHYDNVCRLVDKLVGYDQSCKVEQVCETVQVYDYTEVLEYDDGSTETVDHYKPDTQCSSDNVCTSVPVYKKENECKDEPVYRNVPVNLPYYFYSSWEWEGVAPAVTSGSNNSPHWPEVALNEKRREVGQRSFSFQVLFRLSDKEKTAVPYLAKSAEEFATYTPGTMWFVVRNGFSIVGIEPYDKSKLPGQ